MSMTWDQIVVTIRLRQLSRNPLIEAMLAVRQRYNAEWVLPYPNRDDSPDLPPTTPLLIADAIDFLGLRAADQRPIVASPAISAAKQTGIRSRDYANRRRVAMRAMWRESRGDLQLRRAFRHLAGYASTAFHVTMDYEAAGGPRPTWTTRDPLAVLPEEKAPEDLTPVSNCAIIHAKSADWLYRTFPSARAENGGPISATDAMNGDELWDVAEWVDEYDCVLGILGPRDLEAFREDPSSAITASVELARYPNHAGRCTIVVPHAVTLDRVFSSMQALVGTVDLYGRLQALQIVATEKSIFPDTYIVGHGAMPPEILGGTWKDGRTGDVNVLHNVDSVGQLRATPDPTNRDSIDRLERNFRVSSGLVPQAGGESYGALRTGRANDSMLSASVDPRIAELHDIVTPDLELVHEIALEMWRSCPFSAERKYYLFGGAGEAAEMEVIPATHIETTNVVVAYAVPGADAQGLTINLGQMVGAKMLSQRSAMDKHPWIDNPEQEQRRIIEETLEEAALSTIVQKAQMGELPLNLLARIEEKARGSADIFEAIREAEKEIREEQAAPPEPEMGPDGMPMPMPEMQPGMDGMPAPAGQLPVPPPMPDQMPGPGAVGPTDNQQGLRALLSALSQSPPGGESAAVPMPV